MTWSHRRLLKSCQQILPSRRSVTLKPKSGLGGPASPPPDLRSEKFLILNDWGYTDLTLVTGVPIPKRLKMNVAKGGSPHEGKFEVVVLGDGRAGGK